MKIRKSMKRDNIIRNTNDFYKDCINYADPLFGVGCATSAGPTLPSGSIHPSPETLEKDNGGYTRNQPIVGFGQAYVSGSGGVKCYGNFLLAPMDSLYINDAERARFAIEGTEKARCYEYTATLENGIKMSVTPAHNSAIYEFVYPKGKDAYLLFDVARKLDIEACMKEGFVATDSKTVWGGGVCTGNWNPADWKMYFAMEFDTDFEEAGTFKGDKITSWGKDNIYESINDFEKLGMYVKFPSDEKDLTVRVKISISFVSTDRAKEFLKEQIKDFDYEAVKENAKNLWTQTLGIIELETNDKALLRRFYTAMYHMNIQPRNRINDHGKWDDFHTVWDTWKTVFPMYSLLYPEKISAIVESFIERAKENEEKNNGIVVGDQFMTAIEGIAGQGGNDIDNVIADAYLKGIELKKYDWEDAYKVLLMSAEKMRSKEYIQNGFSTDNAKTASGVDYTWRFKPAASTLGFAVNDKAVARIAKELGSEEEYQKYEARSRNWLNVWNMKNESEGFYGFPQIRNADGTFDEGFNAHEGYNTHFYEATAWDASYINYNDTPLLVETMGGSETFTKRLLWACEHSKEYFNDDHGKEGYLNFTNEPSFQIPWLFCIDEVRRPDLAAKVIDDIIENVTGVPSKIRKNGEN